MEITFLILKIYPIEAMCKVWGLRLGSNFGMQLAADKNFYLRLTFEEMRGFVVFIEKYLAAIWLMW